jgi:inhibitor of cysteine peptidase
MCLINLSDSEEEMNMKKYLLTICFILFSMTAYAVSKGKNVIQVNQRAPQFMIKQTSTPSTGYSWSVKYYDSHLIKLVKTWEEPATSQVAGASGKTLWTFEALPEAFAEPVTTRIELVYARPWAPDDNPKRVSYLVVIKP